VRARNRKSPAGRATWAPRLLAHRFPTLVPAPVDVVYLVRPPPLARSRPGCCAGCCTPAVSRWRWSAGSPARRRQHSAPLPGMRRHCLLDVVAVYLARRDQPAEAERAAAGAASPEHTSPPHCGTSCLMSSSAPTSSSFRSRIAGTTTAPHPHRGQHPRRHRLVSLVPPVP
jgi:hypothetical protein